MPLNQFLNPEDLLKKDKITFGEIPVCEYSRTLEEERKCYSDATLLDVYRDMLCVRTFEDVIFKTKTEGSYKGYKFDYEGPAHLAIGQEAAAVGQALALDVNDFSFGNHRSHAELLARAFAAIRTLGENDLFQVLSNYSNGLIFDVVQRVFKGESIKELGRKFILYGAFSEIFARSTGFQKGLGGGMHLFFDPFGIYPSNAVVGGSAPIATGAALYKKIRKKAGIAVANIGDGASGCGVVHEAMNFAAMDQYNELWDNKGGLPVLFNFLNNGYAMGGQTRGETMAFGSLARIGAGINPDMMHAERINGLNPLAVADATARQKELLLGGKGPALLDVITYRLGGHAATDEGKTYRSVQEVKAWQKYDPLFTYPEELIKCGVATRAELDKIKSQVEAETEQTFRLAADLKTSPYIASEILPSVIEENMFGAEVHQKKTSAPEVLIPIESNSRVKDIAKKQRYAFNLNGTLYSQKEMFNLRDAIFESIIGKFYAEPELIAYGEDVRDWGGTYGVYKGLTESLPYGRLFNSPISEGAIVSTAVGYALSGGRAVIELMYSDFIGRAADEIFNQLAKWRAMSAGRFKMPVVLRVSVGARYGSQHSQDWVSLPAHIPGLKVVYPATPYDAKGLMNSALSGDDPVVFFESQRLYDRGEEFKIGGVPTDYYEISLGEPDIKREGEDLTILTIGAALYKAVEAADILRDKYKVFAEIIDARSVVPFNYDKVVASVKKTGRIILVGDACTRGSILNDMAQNVSALCFEFLKAAPVVIGSRNWVTPPVDFCESFYPQAQNILSAVIERFFEKDCNNIAKDFSKQELLRRAKKGV